MIYYHDLGTFLKHIRASRKWSLRQLSSYMGISHSTLSDIERGITRIQKEHIARLVSIAEFTDSELSDFYFYATINRSDIYDTAILLLVSNTALHGFILKLSERGYSSDEINNIVESLKSVVMRKEVFKNESQ